MMPESDTMIVQDESPIDTQPDFIREDAPGDVEGNTAGSNRDEGGEQAVPPEAWLGEPNHLEKQQEAAARGFLSMLLHVFTPQPVSTEAMQLTADDEFAASQSLMQVRDALRYLGTTSIKVTDVPAKRQKLYTVTVKTDASRVAGFQANRKKLLISNPAGGATVYLGEDITALNTDVSYALAAGDSITIDAQGEVWCLSAAGGEKLNVHAEFYE